MVKKFSQASRVGQVLGVCGLIFHLIFLSTIWHITLHSAVYLLGEQWGYNGVVIPLIPN